MSQFIEQGRHYNEVHSTKNSWITHVTGVSFLLLALLVLLGFVRIVIPDVLHLKLADVAALVLLGYYFRLQWALALVMVPVFIILLWIADWFNHNGPTEFGLWSFIIFFLIGLALLIVSHIASSEKINAHERVKNAIIAPLLLIAEGFFRAGRMRHLQDSLYKHGAQDTQKKDESNSVDS